MAVKTATHEALIAVWGDVRGRPCARFGLLVRTPMQQLADAIITVYTFKRGLLSKVAHDLRLKLERFELLTDGERVEGEFFLESLLVEGAIKNGQLAADALSDKDRCEIHDTIRKRILDLDRHPIARFEGKAKPRSGGLHITGELELRGRRETIEADLVSDGKRLTGKLELVPSRWGIEPFEALLGAIKLQDKVIVQIDVAEP